MDVAVACWKPRVFTWSRMCDVYAIPKWSINLLISRLMAVPSIILLWKTRLARSAISTSIFRWVGFDNGFESMIGKLPFLDLDSRRKVRHYGPSWTGKTQIHTGVIELLSLDTIWLGTIWTGPTKTLYSFFDFSIKRNMTNGGSNVYTKNFFFYTSYY